MIDVRVDDLAFVAGDAIVRPVRADLLATTPLLRRMETAAGEGLTKQLQLQDALPVGAAVVTGAGALTAELLVHAVVVSDEQPVSGDTVRKALTSALHRVEAWQLRTIAIAPFGLGAGNLDIEDSAAIMTEVLAMHLRRARVPESVTFIAETADEESALWAAVRRRGL